MRTVSYDDADQALTSVIVLCQRAGMSAAVLDALLQAKQHVVLERPSQPKNG